MFKIFLIWLTASIAWDIRNNNQSIVIIEGFKVARALLFYEFQIGWVTKRNRVDINVLISLRL